MKKDLEKSLRHIQKNPTTGTAHNQQLISTQVEEIFALDRLTKEVKTLGKIVSKTIVQSEKMKKSNYRLQMAIMVLTALSTGVIVFPATKLVIAFILNSIPELNKVYASTDFTFLATLLSLIVVIITFVFERIVLNKYSVELEEELSRISGKINAQLREKKDNSKEVS